jgi:hypothetical protein
MTTNNNISGGAFLIARKIFTSEVWLKKPSSWGKIWIYILGNVNHSDHKGFVRGEGFFNFSEERKLIGNDVSADKIKKFIKFARESSMIRTTRSTRGMIVKVLNYNEYQDIFNFRSTNDGTREAREKHERSTPINNNGNNGNNGNNVKEEGVSGETFLKTLPDLIVDLFVEIHGNYTVLNYDDEKKGAQKLLDLYFEKFPKMNQEIVINEFRNYFVYCRNIKDEWIKSRLSLPFIVKNFNLINNSKKDGNKQQSKKGGASLWEALNAAGVPIPTDR